MNSHRQILKSSAIIGGSTVIAIAIGILKVKFLAILLGAAGVGLMGVFQNIMGVAATAASCGLNTSGVRQLAASHGERSTLDAVRHALLRGNFVLGLVGGILLWLGRGPISQMVFKDSAHATELGILGIGVFFTLIAASQAALLQGMRKIAHFARVNIFGAIFGALFGIGFAWWLGSDGIVWFVIAAPLTGVIAGTWYASRLPRPVAHPNWPETRTQLSAMLRLGIPFMISMLLTLATQLLARTMIIHNNGINAAGHFQASWFISINYIGIVLGAISTDYYPRLSAVISEPDKARTLVAEQSEMALLLSVPALIALITVAPWVIYLFYAPDFNPAVELLRWQSLGNFFKVASLPMSFILVAHAKGGWFMFTEAVWNLSYLAILFFGLPIWGLDAAGYGFVLSYLIYFILLIAISFRLICYRVRFYVWISLIAIIICGFLLILLSHHSQMASLGVGTILTIFIGLYCLHRIDSHVDLRGWLRHRRHRKPTEPPASTLP